MRSRFPVMLFAAILTVRAFAQDQQSAEYVGTPEEKEFIELAAAVAKKDAANFAEAEKIDDGRKRFEFYAEHDSAKVFGPKLLAFEERHPRTPVGLMALREVVMLWVTAPNLTRDREAGFRKALARLVSYADEPLLISILQGLPNAPFEHEVESLLRSLCNADKVHPVVRDYSVLIMVRRMLSARDLREYLIRRRQELETGAKPKFADEEFLLQQYLARLPNASQIQSLESETTGILRKLAASISAKTHRQPAVKNVDPNGHLLRVDGEGTKAMPTIAELAEAHLFKESHLRPGKPAPDIQTTLTSGKKWSLSSERGRTVIIQFSLKGCVPCEEMYPVLRAMQKEYADRLSILSVMVDDERKDTEEAVASGKLTGNVHWDGARGVRGSISTLWSVTAFPTVYVIDAEGRIASGGHGEELAAKIAELLK